MAWSEEDRADAIRIICDRMAKGEALKDICETKGMPGYSTVLAWRVNDPTFQELYARAREDRAEWLADELVTIADTEPDAAKARNRMDARKWAAAKLAPKTYGDKLDVSGGFAITLTDEQLDARLADFAAKAGMAIADRREGTPEGEA